MNYSLREDRLFVMNASSLSEFTNKCSSALKKSLPINLLVNPTITKGSMTCVELFVRGEERKASQDPINEIRICLQTNEQVQEFIKAFYLLQKCAETQPIDMIEQFRLPCLEYGDSTVDIDKTLEEYKRNQTKELTPKQIEQKIAEIVNTTKKTVKEVLQHMYGSPHGVTVPALEQEIQQNINVILPTIITIDETSETATKNQSKTAKQPGERQCSNKNGQQNGQNNVATQAAPLTKTEEKKTETNGSTAEKKDEATNKGEQEKKKE